MFIGRGLDVDTTRAASFGDLLRRDRLTAGLTQEALAERAGLSVRAISDLERSARRSLYRAFTLHQRWPGRRQ